MIVAAKASSFLPFFGEIWMEKQELKFVSSTGAKNGAYTTKEAEKSWGGTWGLD